MTTALDSNVLAALWDRNDALNMSAQRALDAALERGGLVIAAPVFAELLANPGRTEAFLDSFLDQTGITVDWILSQRVWRTAGRAFQAYTLRRRKQREAGSRRILADFLIGAHALLSECSLLTFDTGVYRAAFPRLRLMTVS